jgi:poly(A) polymerase
MLNYRQLGVHRSKPPGHPETNEHSGIFDINDFTVIPAERHGLAVKDLCPNTTEVVERLQEAGHEAYIVGGSVRDLILGKIPKDFDVATDATPEEVKHVFPRCHLIGRRFRLAHVRQRGVLVEVATFRGPGGASSAEQRHADGRILRDNVWGTLEEDAFRRDFTINALFMDPVTGDIRDFVGGFDDLANRRLKLIGDPVTRYREDPVRLLRAARFVAKLGVEPEPATAEPIAGMAELLEGIPPARLFEEVCKLFLTGHAARTLEALQRFGLTRALFPVLRGKGGPGKVEVRPLLREALLNTDSRVAEEKSVTPAFLYAALLWQPVTERAEALQSKGEQAFMALQQAADEIVHEQITRTALPRRFSAVTREIWLMQYRLNRTRGRRAMRILSHPKFRAGYDFLLLRAMEDASLQELADFWTQAQKERPVMAEGEPQRRPRRRRRPRKKPAASR